MNILISCPGKMYETVDLLKKGFARHGFGVIATGNSEQISGLYAADQAFIVPSVEDPAYIPQMLDICRQNQVKAILTLLDLDLVVLSAAAPEFRKIGVMPLMVDHEVARICDNKFLMYQYLQAHGFKCAKTMRTRADLDKALASKDLQLPIFAKPEIGDGSRGAMKCQSIEDIELCSLQSRNLIFQEFLDGPEYDVDLYVDTISGRMVSVFAKEKIVKVIGGTATAVSAKDEEILTLCGRLAQSLGAVGALNIEIFKVEGEFYIGEVNPRFGATYIGAHACGVDFAPLIINNINGIENQANFGDYRTGIYMMKYEDVHIIRPVERLCK